MAGFFARLFGTVSSFFQIGGAEGPGWSAPTTGGIDALDATQTTFVIARGADPVGPNDFVTKEYLASNGPTIQPLALSGFAFAEGTTFASTQYTVGIAFFTSLPFTMTGIKLYWLYSGLLGGTDLFTVSIWNSLGTLLANANGSATASGEVTVLFSSPLTLPSEALYTIGYCCTQAGSSTGSPYTPYAQTGQGLLPPIENPYVPQFAGPGVMYQALSLYTAGLNLKPTNYPFSFGAFMPLQPVFQ